MADDQRAIELEVEVPGTPEEVWRAIATGPGISSWYVPHEVDERPEGTAIASFGEGLGTFMELEAVFDGRPEAEPDERRKVEHLLKELGVTEADFVPVSYETLLDGEAGEVA